VLGEPEFLARFPHQAGERHLGVVHNESLLA
jgi:hypothetical protein